MYLREELVTRLTLVGAVLAVVGAEEAAEEDAVSRAEEALGALED